MTTPLVSASELASLRSVAEMGMQSEVTIYKRTFDDTNVLSDDETIATESTIEVKGWLRTVPAGDINNVNGMQATVPSYRLFVPVGTDIANQDRVEIGGRTFIVQDTSVENTWQVLLRCQLERVE